MKDFCLKTKHSNWNSTGKKSVCEMKNKLNEVNGRLGITEEKISEYEVIETPKNIEWKDNYKKYSINGPWDFRWPNMCVIEVSKKSMGNEKKT